MPRSTRESSDDENEVKNPGRRTKTVVSSSLNTIIDSPLRRSTRNKQQTISPPESNDINDASSTSTSTSISTVSAPISSLQSGRNTRRRTITTIPESTTISESLLSSTRSLRSRKTSTTSTTSTTSMDNLFMADPVVVVTDCESLKDSGKSRVTRKSISTTTTAAATGTKSVSSVDTPPTTRLRRCMRAGSESKTMSPSNNVRITRRTRASSVDLEEQRNEVKPITYNTNNSSNNCTPVKTRKRASVIPSEPSVVEEIENTSQTNNCIPLSNASIIETVETIVNTNNDNLSPSTDNNYILDIITNQEKKIENNYCQESVNNNKFTENNYYKIKDNNDCTVNQEKLSSSPVLQINISEDKTQELDQETTIINDFEKLPSSLSPVVVLEIKSPIKQNDNLINDETTSKIINHDDNKSLYFKTSTIINSDNYHKETLSIPDINNKNDNLNDESNKSFSLEKSPGNKENVDNKNEFSDSVILLENKFKKTTSQIIPSVRKSLNILSDNEKIEASLVVNKRLNKSLEINPLSTDESNLLPLIPNDTNKSSEPLDSVKSTTNNVMLTTTTTTIIADSNDNIQINEQENDLNSSHNNNNNNENYSNEQVILKSTDEQDDFNLTCYSPMSKEQEEQEKSTENINKSDSKDNDNIIITESSSLESSSNIIDHHNHDSTQINNNDDTDNVDNDIENLFHDIPADEWKPSTETDTNKVEIESTAETKITETTTVVHESQIDNQIPTITQDSSDNNLDKNNKDMDNQQSQDMNCNSDSNDTLILTKNNDELLKLSIQDQEQQSLQSMQFQESMDVDSDDNDTEIEPDLQENINNEYLLKLNKKNRQSDIVNQTSDNKISNSNDDNKNNDKSISNFISSSCSLSNNTNNDSLSEKISSPIKKSDNSTTAEFSSMSLSSSLLPITFTDDKINISKNKKLLRKSLDSAKFIISNDKNKTQNNINKNLNFSFNDKLVESIVGTENIIDTSHNEKNNSSVSKLIIINNKSIVSVDKITSPLNKSNNNKQQHQHSSNDEDDVFSSNYKFNNNNKNKSKFKKNFEINSDSNDNYEDDYSDSLNNKSIVTAPSVLLNDEESSSSIGNDNNCSSSENNDSDIDSDIAREYNFDGNSVSEYSDDNVIGDECRESETELSDDDDDDQDDDMANFINDDDEEEDRDEDEIENEEDEDKSSMLSLSDVSNPVADHKTESEIEKDENESESESEEENDEDDDDDDDDDEEKEKEKKDNDGDVDEIDEQEVNYKSGLSKVQKILKFDSYNTDYENDKDKHNKIYDSVDDTLSKKLNNNFSSNTINKKLLTTESKSCNSTPINSKFCMGVSKSADSKIQKNKSKKIINNKLDNEIKSIGSLKKLKSTNDTNTVKSSSSKPHNKSMEILNLTDHDTILLMKEKLNETLPTLKLQHHANRLSLENSKLDINETNKENTLKAINNEIILSKKNKTNKSCSAITDDQNFVIYQNEIKKSKKNKNLESITMITTSEFEKSFDEDEKTNDKKNLSTLGTSDKKVVKLKDKIKKNKNTIDNDNNDYKILSSVVVSSKRIEKNEEKEKKTKQNIVKIESNSCHKFNENKKGEKKLSLLSSTNKNLTLPSTKNNLKRLSDDVIENLPDIQPQKKIKLSSTTYEKIVPTKKMFDSKHPKPDNMIIETQQEFLPSSSNGGTTKFSVININKSKKQQSKKSAAAYSFRQRILGRNPRQPISAYLMYQQKKKTLSKDKY
ncbi:dentin sialophosphoprotein [Microplitis demolitor]|uniref:dentin sialophosphoprotein n=1 Tax=Microplitis demolitor TaxID=69319 RepID=UPI00235B5CA4|nr:dentin sialophosphoprotein [Microplitis demolitor]